MSDLTKVIIYTDGSSINNPGVSGYCALLECKQNGKSYYRQVSGAVNYSTNNRMELLAVIKGLELLTRSCEVEIVSDSRYVCDGISMYLKSWIDKSFKGIKNPDLWASYVKMSQKHVITTTWIKGHSGFPKNEHCDKVARANAKTLK